ncbi:hypothetical protein NUW58_g7054 [Xylaria curta]|uniref:Uncharacterized protein n=1 Tax=Xylaria curta TaxID=42375 RepID=A0ACC1NL20_9PEZI|nr:hypothetical protein NUW58_g7054 [Xylaria curta]
MPDPRGWASIEENTSPATFRRAAVHGLLSKWLNMCNSYLADNPTCPISQTNLLLFHLISLNSITNFPEIEKYARGQGQNGPQENENRIYVPGETLYHCAEVIQLVQAMPADRRPVWWSAAIYRVALILWTFSMIRPNLASQQDPENESSMFMDNGELIGESSWAFMWKNTATVILTGPNGTTLGLEEPSAILDYAESMVRQGIVTRFDGGIKRKLDCMNHLWHNGT